MTDATQYSQEELLQYTMQQFEENEEFRKKVTKEVHRKDIEAIKILIIKLFKTITKSALQYITEKFLDRLM